VWEFFGFQINIFSVYFQISIVVIQRSVFVISLLFGNCWLFLQNARTLRWSHYSCPCLKGTFTEAAKVHDDGISRHRLAPFNSYYLTQSTIYVGFLFQCNWNVYFLKVSTVLQFTHWVGREFQELITLLLKTDFLTSSLNLLLNSLLSYPLKPISSISKQLSVNTVISMKFFLSQWLKCRQDGTVILWLKCRPDGKSKYR